MLRLFSYPKTLFSSLRLQWIFSVSLLIILPWRPNGAVSAFDSSMNTSEIDLSAPVSRILVTKHFPTVFVGGTNFVAQLSSQLHLLYRFAIGPVEEPEYCWPDPAPCDNTVRLLKMDYSRNLLLVCGSAYQGTCTLHPTNLVTEHSCLLGKSTYRSSSSATLQQPSPGVVVAMGEGDAPVFSQRLNDSTDLQEEDEQFVPGTTAHFLQIKKNKNKGIFPTGPFESCRSPFFGRVEFYDEETHLNQRVRKTRQVGLPGSLPPFDFVSRLMVASFVDLKNGSDEGDEGVSNKEAPLPLSVREIRPFGPGYTISYALGVDGDTPSGFQLADSLQNSSATSFFQDYKLSFSYGNYSYFVFLQRSSCASGQMCITTRVSRVCHENPRLTPYVEIPISCRYGGKVYPLLTSAVLGFSDIQLNLSTERTPVLFAAFGAARKSSSRRADARQGGAVCVFTIHTLNKELNFAVQLCNQANNLAQPARWIKGAKDKCVYSSEFPQPRQQQCSSDPDNLYVQSVIGSSIKALAAFHKTAVCTLWTYTPRLFSASSSVSYQKISLFLLTLDGIISKIILSMTKKRDDISIKVGDAGISEYHKLDVDLLTVNGT
ncbi:hypothetical protein PoB_005982900 [Plakobranchus ocellatus]|uniref:Sema domain-containing protein n=1 Tax=Plakobranchus ocellatus TaxID=259542 RepID=A0AAV4CNC1_9GAST|nr:hypothetical protein PoB_005982900 [Plakobranchus ocellatus]